MTGTSSKSVTFNKYGYHLKWPRIWIIILGIILIFLCLCIAGMEVGNTVFELYRATAFGGFIVFIPLLICGIFVFITAFKPTLILLRIATILCCIMIVLCMALIAYDILVLIDPTRCFFLSCSYSNVTYQVNSTYNATISGWPFYITWPGDFQTKMNAKRIFQSIQLLCAGLFILFCALYILTYMIYRRINLHQQTMYHTDQGTFLTHETSRTPTKNVVQSYPQYDPNHLVTTYTIEAHHSTSAKHTYSPVSVVINTIVPEKTKKKTIERPRANSANYDRLCTRCVKEPRMILATNYERKNYFPHLCINCNNEIINSRRRPANINSSTSHSWKP